MHGNDESLHSKMSIYIPAYNAALTLPRVFDRIPKKLLNAVAEIFVVDNASKDNTHEVATEYSKRPGFEKLKVIRNPNNEGYGGSQKIAYRRAIESKYQGIGMLLGDAQYAPECMVMLMKSGNE